MTDLCPCCDIPWKFVGRPRASWNVMKLTDDGTEVVWVKDTKQSRHLDEEFALHEDGDCIYLAFTNGTIRRVNLDGADIATFNENGSGTGCTVFTQRHNGGASATKRIFTSHASGGASVIVFREEDGTLINSFTPVASTFLTVGGVTETDLIHVAGVIGSSLRLRQYTPALAGIQNWEVNIGGHAGFGLNFDVNATHVATGGSQSVNLSGAFIAPAASTRVYSLAGAIAWSASHGAAVQAVRFSDNGNLITGGESYPVASGGDGMTTRCYDSTGALLWSVDHSNGLGVSCQVLAICCDPSNNVYAAGGLSSADGFNIRKYNSSGTLQWSFDWSLGQTGHDALQNGMAIDWFDNHLYISGRRVVRS